VPSISGNAPGVGRLVYATNAISVLDYGAAGNGTTDDTTALRNTVTAAGEGGLIMLPEGVYKVTDSVTLMTGQTLAGYGQAVIYQADLDSADTGISPTVGGDVYSAILIPHTAANVCIVGVTFRGDNDPYSSVDSHASAAVDFLYSGETAPTDCTVRDCVFENLYGFGVHAAADAGSGIRILDNVCRETGPAINVNSDYSVIRGNTLTDTHGIEASGGYAVISGNVINTTAGVHAGISLGGRTDPGSYGPGMVCADNVITLSGGKGISVNDGVSDAIISGNTIRASTRGGITITGSTNPPARLTIADNVLTSCGKDDQTTGNRVGIYSTGVNDLTVSGNQVLNGSVSGYQTTVGIEITGGARVTVAGNSVYGNTTNKDFSANGVTGIMVYGNRWTEADVEYIGGTTKTTFVYSTA